MDSSIHIISNNTLLGYTDIEKFGDFFYSSGYFRFCFVRNPITRILSCYLNKFQSNNVEEIGYRNILELDLNKDSISFNDFLLAISRPTALFKNRHWVPQVNLLGFDAGVNNFDFVGRQENFSSDFELVKEKIFSKDRKKIHELDNSSTVTYASNKVDQYYTKDNLDLIKKLYKDDFREFLYSTDTYFSKS